MKQTRWVAGVSVLGLAIAAGAAWWFQQKPSVPPAGATSQSPVGGAAPASGGGPTGAGGPAAGRPGGPGGAGGAGGPGGPGGPVAVEVAPAKRITLTDDAQGVGGLRSRQGVMLRPEVSGRVAQIGFSDGQSVRRGQVLVQLDDTLQQAQLQQAQAQSSIARTNLQRSRELLAQQFISQSAVDQNAAALQVAEAQVALAQAQMARLRIVAPFDGRAGVRLVNIGDFVKDGADLVNIEDSRAMLVDVRLPERYAARLKVGQAVQLDVDALPGKTFQARVDATDSQVDANGRSMLVRARVENPAGELRAGMFARARVVFSVREKAIVVPEEALVPLGGKQWIVKVVDGPEGKPVSQRLEAKIGLRLPGQVEVLEGVSESDRVVTAGHGRLMRDQPVPLRIIDLAAAGRGGGPGGPAGPGGGRPGGPGGTTSAPAARPASGV